MGKILVKSYNPRVYEQRSLLNEAIENRIAPMMREWELQSIYQGPEVATVNVMHKYDGTYDEIAWVLMGDSISKSNELYAFIDSVIKNQPGQAWNPSANRTSELSQASRGQAASMLPGAQGAGAGGLSGGAAQDPSGKSNQQSHPQQAAPAADPAAPAAPQAQPGLMSRMGTWAKERALPAAGRAVQHAGSALMGGLAGAALGPMGALAGAGAGLGGSMRAAGKRKERGEIDPVFRGEGALGGIAADAAKAGGAAAGRGATAAKQGAQDFAQNFQQGGGVGGFVGQAARTAKNLPGQMWQGAKNAWGAGGDAQQQNAAAAAAPAATGGGGTIPGVAGPGNAPGGGGGTPAPAAAPTTGGGPPGAGGEVATTTPQAAQQATQQQLPGPGQGQQPGIVANQGETANQNLITMASDNSNAYNSIEAILKGW